MKIFTWLIAFLLLSAFFIISNENLVLRNNEEFMKFGNTYYSWLGHIFNQAKTITTYAVKADWLPKTNQLNSTS